MIRFLQEFKNFFKLLALLALSAFLVYYVPVKLNRALFLLFLIPIWKSKKDFFWYAFLLIMLDYPGGLFHGGCLDDPFRLPVYNFAPQISFSFDEIIIILFILKGFFKKRWQYRSFVFKKQYNILAIYLFLLIAVSFSIGFSPTSMRYTYKTLIKISLYFSAIFVFSEEDEVIGFFKALFPFAFVAILFQLFGMIYHKQFVAMLKPGVTVTQGVLIEGQLMRPIEMVTILLCCFFGSFLYLNNRRKIFSDIFLIVINITSYIGILMSATRSWFLGLTIMYFIYILLNKSKKIVKNLAMGLFIFLTAMFLSPMLKNQIDQSWSRLETIELLIEGDITADGSMSRLTIRGPRVMEGFKKSTILFGAGFSDLYYKYGDGHVGFQNILLNTGIIGSILLFLFALTLFFKPLGIANKLDDHSDMKSILLSLPLLVPAVLVITSGTQFWGYGVGEPARVMLLAFYICISSVYINIYKKSSQANLECET